MTGLGTLLPVNAEDAQWADVRLTAYGNIVGQAGPRECQRWQVQLVNAGKLDGNT